MFVVLCVLISLVSTAAGLKREGESGPSKEIEQPRSVIPQDGYAAPGNNTTATNSSSETPSGDGGNLKLLVLAGGLLVITVGLFALRRRQS
ncbi:MAG: hypothetical protein SV760_04575 [Halobacteria archaeon]|nr:hypothetical protein [Halobacteria archaeon]